MIPVIDLKDFMADRPGALAVTGRAIHDALTQVGFFVITGHGVPDSLMREGRNGVRRGEEVAVWETPTSVAYYRGE